MASTPLTVDSRASEAPTARSLVARRLKHSYPPSLALDTSFPMANGMSSWTAYLKRVKAQGASWCSARKSDTKSASMDRPWSAFESRGWERRKIGRARARTKEWIGWRTASGLGAQAFPNSDETEGSTERKTSASTAAASCSSLASQMWYPTSLKLLSRDDTACANPLRSR